MNSRTSTLDVYLSGANIGVLSQEAGGRHWFTYNPDYTGPALSLSMPPTTRRWGPDRVEPFIAGLVPDDPVVRKQLAREHDAVAGNPFSLLRVTGQDCAGAVQFLAPGQTPDTFSSLQPITEDDITARLTRITGPSASNWLAGREHWSLAGMQAKIALHRDPGSGRWFEAQGSAPTTHIIKPAGPLPLHALNEALCLRALSELDIPTAHTELHMFGDIPSVVSTRWDRVTAPTGSVERIPQEDLCQAMHVHPDRKYAADGGPQAYEIARFLADTAPGLALHLQFTQALILNVLLGNTDAHAKNYSILRPVRSPLQLAPLYDVASVFPYDDADNQRLAMKIGGRNIPSEIELRHWHRYADKAGVPQETMNRMLLTFATELPGALQRAVIGVASSPAGANAISGTEGQRLISRLVTSVGSHCQRVRNWF